LLVHACLDCRLHNENKLFGVLTAIATVSFRYGTCINALEILA
jgi:hypothetical protein